MGFFVIFGRRVFGLQISLDDRPDCHWLVRDFVVQYAIGSVVA